MITLASIVEGHGEVSALPILLGRFSEFLPAKSFINVLQPIRVRRDKFLKNEDEFRTKLLLAATKCDIGGWILVVLDADDDCPSQLGRHIYKRAQEYVPHRRLSVVIANREFEAWFFAAAQSLDGKRNFSFDINKRINPESHRDAKGLMSEHMGRSYKPVLDQSAFAKIFDLKQARDNSRSFRKLCKEWQVSIVDLLHSKPGE